MAVNFFRTGKPRENAFDLDLTDDGFPELASTGSGSGSAGSLLNAQVNRDKFLAEQAAAVAAANRTRAGTQASTDYIRRLLDTSGQSFGNLESQIASQEATGRTYIEDQARALSDLISGRRTQARDVTTRGYDTLRDFLGANPMQAYAQTQRAVPTVQENALEQYMASRGIGSQPAQAGQDVANAQLAAQSANYNQLLNVLQGAETQQQSSRVAEEQMARALAGTQLEALYGSQTAGLEQQRLAALNELLGRSSSARLNAEQLRIAREQQLQDAIAKLLGTGIVDPLVTEGGVDPNAGAGTGTGVGTVAPTVSNAIAQLVNLPNINSPTLAARIEEFANANPNATKAQIAKSFPKLAKNIKNQPRQGGQGSLMEFE